MEQQEEILTPSYHGELCRHNGDNPDYEIACDECDYYLACFPYWEEVLKKFNNNDRIIDYLNTSSDESLEAYLRAGAAEDNTTD